MGQTFPGEDHRYGVDLTFSPFHGQFRRLS
jgi:hypothetical protein